MSTIASQGQDSVLGSARSLIATCVLFYPCCLTASPEGDITSKFPSFYDWAFPKRIEGAKYTEVFNPDLTPKKYIWSSSNSRNEAYLDTTHLLADSLQPGFLENPEHSISTILASKIIFEPEYVLKKPEIADGLLPELSPPAKPLSAVDKVLLARDIWNVILKLRGSARQWQQEGHFEDYEAMKKMENKFIGVYSKLFEKESEDAKAFIGGISREIELEDLVRAVADEGPRRFFGGLITKRKPVAVPMNPSWDHMLEFEGASLAKIWKWDDGKGAKGAIFVRYATFPVAIRDKLIRPTVWVEEINVSGLGDSPDFIEDSGRQPWQISFGFSRKGFAKAVLEAEDKTKPAAYLITRGMEDRVLIGFASDTVGGPIRGGRHVLTRRVSCVECHGGVSKDDQLPLLHERQYTNDPFFILKRDEPSQGYRVSFPPLFEKRK